MLTGLLIVGRLVFFLYHSGPPAEGWHHRSGLVLPPTIYQENTSQASLQDNLKEAAPQLSTQVTLVCVKPTKTLTNSLWNLLKELGESEPEEV